ncbi:hypothetical protein [Rhodopseudomonas palustris]|uniref:Uncharacterized protein n=1 Tax=Rhodopseudomonas palustris (strain BisB18) TaxID=316056 RepID=Q21A97_RHOPB
MVDASTNKATSPPAAAAMASPSRAAGNGATAPHRTTTASFDEMLAKEVLASFRRTQAMARPEPAKPKRRGLLPPATLVVRPAKSYPWTMPFASLATYVAVSTLLCAGGLAYVVLQPSPVAKPQVADLRTIRESVEQLRRNVAELSDDVAATKTALAAANQAVSERIGRLASRIHRADQAPPTRKVERLPDDATPSAHADPTDASGEVTGSIQRPRPANPVAEVITGWRVRRAYDGVALLEGPSGVIEVNLGQDVPNLGRIQDIRTVNGRPEVATTQGVINSAR